MVSLHHQVRRLAPGQLIAIACLVIAFLIALVLRFYRLDLIDFRFDQAYPLQYALDITQGRFWAVQPHGSTAVHPPVYLYLMAIPYLFTRDFATVVSFRVFLDVISVGLCWLIGYRYFNWRVASISAVLYAFAPWAIQFARNTWPVPQPMFSAIAIIGILEVSVRHNRWGWTIAGIGLALCAGTHLAGVYVIPTVLVALWIGRKSFRIKQAILGLAPLVLLAVVYLVYDAGHAFANITSIIGSFGKPSVFSFESLQYTTWLSGGTHLSDLTGQAYQRWIKGLSPLWANVDMLQVALLAVGMVVSIFLAIRQTIHNIGKFKSPVGDNPANYTIAAFILLLWWWIPVLLQLRHSQPMMMQYLPAVLPAPFLITAIGLDVFLSRIVHRPPRVKQHPWLTYLVSAICVLLVIVIMGWQLIATMRLYAVVERYDTSNGYGLPVRSALAAVQHAREAHENGLSGDVVVVVKDYVTPWHEQGLILKVLMADIPHRFINSDVDGWIFRPDGTAYILAPGTEPVLDKLGLYVDPERIKKRLTPIRSELSKGYLFAQLPELQSTGSFTATPVAFWESGIKLLGYDTAIRDKELRVIVMLQVVQTPPENVDYHWYNHIFAGEEKIAGIDGSGVHPNAWRAGDIVIQQFGIPLDKPLPSSPLTLKIGSYTYPQQKIVMVTVPGQPAQNGVVLQLTNQR